MAVASYTNKDGLTVLYAPSDSVVAQGGSRSQVDGPTYKVEYEINASDLLPFGTGGKYTVLDNVRIPKNALISTATLTVKTAFASGGAATLTLGLAKKDGTEVDYDGLFAAAALSTINAQGKQAVGAGALVKGVAVSDNSYLYALVGTANYTAGNGTLVIEYLLP